MRFSCVNQDSLTRYTILIEWQSRHQNGGTLFLGCHVPKKGLPATLKYHGVTLHLSALVASSGLFLNIMPVCTVKDIPDISVILQGNNNNCQANAKKDCEYYFHTFSTAQIRREFTRRLNLLGDVIKPQNQLFKST